MVGHESAAIVTYEELEEWANKSDELVKNCSIPENVYSEFEDWINKNCYMSGGRLRVNGSLITNISKHFISLKDKNTTPQVVWDGNKKEYVELSSLLKK